MHGIIFAELQKYAEARYGPGTWSSLLQEAGLGTKLYTPFQSYPDEEIAAIVAAASRKTTKTASTILEDFGDFIAPDLIGLYKALVKPEWRTLELLENAEGTIHRVVRASGSGARPPEIKCTRVRENEIVVSYVSQRRLCAVAKGIIRGVAKFYGERISLIDTSCMLRGGAQCTINVRLLR